MRDNTGLFACPATMEVGKLIGEARDEVNLSGDLIEYHATNAERFLATQKLTPIRARPEESSPLGVLLGVQPWNFPTISLPALPLLI